MTTSSASIAIDGRILGTTTGRYVERLLDEIQEIDETNSYTLFVLPGAEGLWRPSKPNFRVVTVDVPYNSVREQTSFLRIIRRGGYDLVHFTMPQQPLLYRGLTVTTFFDLNLLRLKNERRSRFVSAAKRFVGRIAFVVAARKASTVIASSAFTQNDVIELSGIEASKIEVIPLAADLPAGTETTSPDILVRAPFLLYVGSQLPYKNVRLLIKEHCELRKEFPQLELILVGRIDDYAEENLKYVTDHGMEGVRFAGFQSDSTLSWLYEHCSAYVVPSLLEGFGLPGLEAMLAGAAVISSSATCLPEVYADGALYFDPHVEGELARIAAGLLRSDDERNSLRERGRRRARSFSWHRTADATHEVYLNALGRSFLR